MSSLLSNKNWIIPTSKGYPLGKYLGYSSIDASILTSVLLIIDSFIMSLNSN
jgi:hypothetical protein